MTIQGDWNAGCVGYAIESTYGTAPSTLYAVPGRDVELEITPKRNIDKHNEVGRGQLVSYVSKGLQVCDWKLTYNMSHDFYGRSMLQIILSATASTSDSGVTYQLTPDNDPMSITIEQQYGSIYRLITGGVVTSATIGGSEGELTKVEISGMGYYTQNGASVATTAPTVVYPYLPIDATGDTTITVNDGTSDIDYIIRRYSLKVDTGAKLHYGIQNGISPSNASKGKLDIGLEIEVLEGGESYYDNLDTDFTVTITYNNPSTQDIIFRLNNARITSDPKLSAKSDMGERVNNYVFTPTGGPSGLYVSIPGSET